MQINQRKQEIENIGIIMENINTIAKDIAVETLQQKEKLQKIDDQMF